MDIRISQSSKADIFAALFQHIKLFTEHVNIMFQDNGLYIQTMDSSRISILEITLPAAWFDEYKFTQNITLGVNALLLFKVLSTRDPSQTLHIQYDEEQDDKLFVHFQGQGQGTGQGQASSQGQGPIPVRSSNAFDKHFEIPLMAIDNDLMSIPAIEYQAEFSVPSANFAALVNQLRLFGDTMQIECSEDKIQLSSNSGETGNMIVDIPIDDLSSFAIQEGERLELSFSLAQLHNICLYSKLARDMEINLTANYPIKLVYALEPKIEDTTSTTAQIVFYLAPKIND